MIKIWVKPGGEDRLVPWPPIAGRRFPHDCAVEVYRDDHYIARRLADGDLVEAEAPMPVKQEAEAPMPVKQEERV